MTTDTETRTFTVGDGATMCYWSDRRAATVVAVSPSGRQVTVQADRAVRTDKNGQSECQTYEYHRNPEGAVYTFTLRKNGRYVRAGDSMRGTTLAHGRHEYTDPSF